MDGSPAQKRDYNREIIIVSVDGQTITSVTDAVSRIRGLAGTSVTLTIIESSGTTKTVTLVPRYNNHSECTLEYAAG